MPSKIRSKREQRDALIRGLRAEGQSWDQIAARIRAEERVNRRVAMRMAHGWTQWEVARRWNDRWPAYDGGAGLTAQVVSYWETWPASGREPTMRTLLHLALLYDCTASDLIDAEHYVGAEAAALAGLAGQRLPESTDAPVTCAAGGAAATAAGGSGASRVVPAAGVLAYRESKEPLAGGPADEREVMMAAHEGSEHAEQAEQRDIGEATLEQLRADVIRLSRDSMTADPLAAFRDMRRVRSRIHLALDRQLWPRDEADLYFLLAVLSGLMGVTADGGLAVPQAGEELIRAGWAYATVIDHRPLMAHLRLYLASIAYWDGRTRLSLQLARSGLEYLADGPNAAQLHLRVGRAAARLGDAGAALQAITAAAGARDREHSDDLLEIGGEFGFSRATQHYLAGSVLIEVPDANADALTELERAVVLYAAGPEPGEDHSFRCAMVTHADLATGRTRAGQLDAAEAALEPILSLPSDKRIRSVSQRLRGIRADLAAPRYHGSAAAGGLDERVEAYLSEAALAVSGLPPGT